MIPDGNFNLQKEIGNSRNDKRMDKTKTFSSYFKTSFKGRVFKPKTIYFSSAIEK